MEKIVYYILTAFAVLITLTVHEYFHGYAAYKLGDHTAKHLGRLTLNPIRHIDPIGALCMLLFRFGWAKPVPINARNLSHPRRDIAIISLAGPLSNLVLSIFSAFLYLLTYTLLRGISFSNEFLLAVAQNSLDFLFIFHSVNIGIAIFNLIPIPPLDGSKILAILLPPKAYFAVMRRERTIYFVLLGWLFIGDFASDFLLSLPIVASNPILSFVATALSLSNILGYAISAISDLIFSIFKLIPFLNT
jgi:Zn-dependent protease